MKKLLNTLYVTTQDTYLRKEGETVVVEKEKQVLLRLPIHTLQGIVTFGNVMTSPFLLNLCAERGVCVSYMSESGRFLARVTGPVSGNVLLRLAQMRAYEDKEKKGEIARSFVIGKLLNNSIDFLFAKSISSVLIDAFCAGTIICVQIFVGRVIQIGP